MSGVSREGCPADAAADLDSRIGSLIEYLLDERSEFGRTAVPRDPDARWALLRALMNTRPPVDVPSTVLELQDSVLTDLLVTRSVTDARAIPPVSAGSHLALWRGDITALAVDAIVNAANSGLLGCFVPGHWCVDNAIHTYAGMQLRIACKELIDAQGDDEPTGCAKTTPGFNLPAKYVIHTVGPIVRGYPTIGQIEQLASCYRSCLEAAVENECKSVAFCCISTGEFHFPRELAAQTAVNAVSSFLERDAALEKIVFDTFTEEDFDVYRRILLGPA